MPPASPHTAPQTASSSAEFSALPFSQFQTLFLRQTAMGGRCTHPNMQRQFPLTTFFFFFFVEQCINENGGVENARRLSSYCHCGTSAYGLPGTKLFFSSAISRDHEQKTLLV
ncbi:unnamed protein product [Ixodes persulcatus]